MAFAMQLAIPADPWSRCKSTLQANTPAKSKKNIVHFHANNCTMNILNRVLASWGVTVSREALEDTTCGTAPESLSPYTKGMVTTICMVTVCQVQKEDAKNWLLSMIYTLPHDQLIRMCVTLWAIWHARWKVIYEDTSQSPLSTHFFVQSFISHLEQVKLSSIFEKKIMKPSTCDHPWWIPPPAGMVKINVDAGMTKTSPSSLVVPVARPETKVFLGSSAILFHVLFQKP
jgi:hypothetical protein